MNCYIPARLDSKRVPGKLMLPFDGVSCILRTYKQVKKCRNAKKVIVVTNSDEIEKEIRNNGGETVFMDSDAKCGTDRIIEYLKLRGEIEREICIVQGDQPFLNPEDVDNCIHLYLTKKFKKTVCTTCHYKIINENKNDRNVVKVVFDLYGRILYGSRSLIPYTDDPIVSHYGHKGIFCYDSTYLLSVYHRGISRLQIIEDLEWLKILEQGYYIESVEIDEPERDLNTWDDYTHLQSQLKTRQAQSIECSAGGEFFFEDMAKNFTPHGP